MLLATQITQQLSSYGIILIKDVRRSIVIKICEGCNSEFNAKKSKTLCCSVECRLQRRFGTLEEFPCKQCGKSLFERSETVVRKTKKFCSRTCSATYNNLNYPERYTSRKRVYYSCCDCAVEVKGGRKRCKSCANAHRVVTDTKTLREVIYTAHHKSSAFALVRSRARYAVKDQSKVCSNCGYSKHVETCHIKSISEFSLETTLKEINSFSNLSLLCRNCHWESHHTGLEIHSIQWYLDKSLYLTKIYSCDRI